MTIFQKTQDLIKAVGTEAKSKIALEIYEQLMVLPDYQILDLMCGVDDIVRNFAARVFANRRFGTSSDDFSKLLADQNENLRDSAVISLCYMNTPANLQLLRKAAEDNSSLVRKRALTGIADIALEYSNNQAIETLQAYLHCDNQEIRELVSEELSLLAV